MIDHKIADLILYITFAVAIISVIIFNFLVILRFFRDRRQQLRQQRKEEMKKKIFLYLNNPVSDLKKNLTSSRRDISILTEVASDLLRNLKGKSYNLLLEIFSDAGVYEYIRYKLFNKNVTK